jgi:hypothetical protein
MISLLPLALLGLALADVSIQPSPDANTSNTYNTWATQETQAAKETHAEQEASWPTTGPFIVEVEMYQNSNVENAARLKHSTYDESTRKAFKMKYNFVQEDQDTGGLEGDLNALVLEGVSRSHLEQMQGGKTLYRMYLYVICHMSYVIPQ